MVHCHPGCPKCKWQPTHRLEPCGHTICYQHFLSCPEDLWGICGICVKRQKIVEIPPTPTPTTPHLKPVYIPWPSNGSEIGLPSPVMDFTGRGRGRDGSGNDLPPIREESYATPTPNGAAGKDETVGASGQSSGRYVPPALRTPPEPPVRPESSMSNDTFLSQIPETGPPSILSGLLVDRTPHGTAGYTPRGFSSYAPFQLCDRSGLPDPFVDPSSAPRPGPSSAAVKSNNTRSFSETFNIFGNTLNPFRNNASVPSNIDGRSVTPASTAPATNFTASAAAFIPAAANVAPSVASSARTDSAGANAFGFDLSRSVNMARLIRSGATDDPTDIDYGNPGRSKRLPPENNDKVLQMPQPRGKVRDSDPMALTVHDSEANTKGSVAAYLGTATVEIPAWLYRLGSGYEPTLEEVYSHLPVMEACRVAKPSSAGVVKITNIPYACSRSEIVAFLGRAAQIVTMPEGSPYHAVHVMIDRGTGKTLDAYVELKHAKEAFTVANQFQNRVQSGRHAKIGDREVKVQVISQGELMAELFPYGKNLVWDHNGVPNISTDREEYYPGTLSKGFDGFLTNEELVHLSKFAETPQRSPFMQRCLIRGYEHLISVLHKYPWFAIDHVLVKERNLLFDTSVRNVRALMGLLRKTQYQARRDNTQPTVNTLQELAVAILTCPGFSEGQKFCIVQQLQEGGYSNMTQPRGMNFRFGGNARFSHDWPFFALVKQPGVQEPMVEYVASLLREATDDTAFLSLADMHAMRASNFRPPFFGKLDVDYTGATTLAHLGRAELRTIEEVLGRVLKRSQNTLGSRLSSLNF